jgi:hypothetical protein
MPTRIGIPFKPISASPPYAIGRGRVFSPILPSIGRAIASFEEMLKPARLRAMATNGCFIYPSFGLGLFIATLNLYIANSLVG